MKGRFGGFVAQMTTRSLHYREVAKNYPKVNIKNVELDKPRFGFRKERQPLISQLVRDTLFPTTKIRARYIQEGKPVPIKYRNNSDEIARSNYEKYQDEVANGLPHFRVGGKQVYLPKARVCLLRPNAKHTPYQAKFLVPRNFNKMDLRDYLWHVYGLRALNVTVQLLHARFTRGPNDYARYRGPQFKKMTIDMEDPFVWPELPDEVESQHKQNREDQIESINYKNATGSNKFKPSEAFGGLYKKPELPNSFVSTNLQKKGERVVNNYNQFMEKKSNNDLIRNYLKL